MQAPAGHWLNMVGSMRVFNPDVADKRFPVCDHGDHACFRRGIGQRQASNPIWTEEKYKKGSWTAIHLIRSTVLNMFKLSSSAFSALVLSAVAAFAYDPTRSDNVSDSLSYRILRAIYIVSLSSWLSIGVFGFRCFLCSVIHLS
jgi:hypothetical protein